MRKKTSRPLIHHAPDDTPFSPSSDLGNLVYLLAKYWANIEVLRYRSNGFSIGDDERGKLFMSFLNCLESKAVRIAKRKSQRAIGELMLEREGDKINMVLYREFCDRISENEDSRLWLNDIMSVLLDLKSTVNRQRVIVYATVLHAMLDSIDMIIQVTKTYEGRKLIVYDNMKELKGEIEQLCDSY